MPFSAVSNLATCFPATPAPVVVDSTELDSRATAKTTSTIQKYLPMFPHYRSVLELSLTNGSYSTSGYKFNILSSLFSGSAINGTNSYSGDCSSSVVE